MQCVTNRRVFLQRNLKAAGVALAAQSVAAPYVVAQSSPNSVLNIACVGVGGMGGSHVLPSAAENLVAVCDVVEGSVAGCLKRVEKAYKDQKSNKPLPQAFYDYREMLDKMGNKIDAVVVATPDHHHAIASMRAIKLGKHVYCQKPLTFTIDEARQLTLAARQHKVATQMGNQGRADEGWRLLCEWIWAGVIGTVKEVHVWTDRPGIATRFWWPQGGGRPAGSDPISKGLHWDKWLGAQPDRPYLDTYKEGKFQGKRVYQPFVWRGWWDFGTGALGDIGCHSMSGIFTALKIEYASAVELIKDTGDTTSEMFPSASTIRWDIPARGNMAPCALYWYDGGLYPPAEVGEMPAGKGYPDNGMIVVGDRGKLTFFGKPQLWPPTKREGFKPPAPSIPRCESNHFSEWLTACKGGRPAFSNFDHAGPLTEFVLLGNLALRAGVGHKVQWDGANMKCINRPDLDRYVRREYRAGWSL